MPMTSEQMIAFFCERAALSSNTALDVLRQAGRRHGAHHDRTTSLATLKPGSRGFHALMTCQVAHFTDQEAIAICGGLV